MIIQRSNTILYCQKWAETIAFYRDLFKFEITHQTDWFVEFKVMPSVYLSIANQERASSKSKILEIPNSAASDTVGEPEIKRQEPQIGFCCKKSEEMYVGAENVIKVIPNMR